MSTFDSSSVKTVCARAGSVLAGHFPFEVAPAARAWVCPDPFEVGAGTAVDLGVGSRDVGVRRPELAQVAILSSARETSMVGQQLMIVILAE